VVKVSHKKFVRHWKPKCRFCPRRTVRVMPLGSLIPVCDKCSTALGDIIFHDILKIGASARGRLKAWKSWDQLEEKLFGGKACWRSLSGLYGVEASEPSSGDH